MMEYRTADGHVVDDALLGQEAEVFERGERPEGWRAPGYCYEDEKRYAAEGEGERPS